MPAKKAAAKRKPAEETESAQVKVLKQEIQAGEAVVAPVAESKDAAGPSPAVVGFLNLLQQAPETKEACVEWFRRCADVLLNNFELVVAGSNVFRFVEIEFYYNDHNVHQDTFIHGSELQLKTAGHWYFHTAGASGTSYKSGTYKGLDITCGKPGKIPGGILLRAMEETSSGDIIEGPCVVVDRLLKQNKIDSILDLVKTGFSLCATDVNPFMYIRPAAKAAGRPVVGSPRVGLTLKRFDAFKETFVMMPYRMTSLTAKIKKNRQTIILALQAQGRSTADIIQITGAKKSNVEDYASQLASAASSKKVPSDWNGATLNTDGLISLFAACQRAGNV
jgi:hypothetical protein